MINLDNLRKTVILEFKPPIVNIGVVKQIKIVI